MAFYMKGAPFQNKENRAEVKAAKEGKTGKERRQAARAVRKQQRKEGKRGIKKTIKQVEQTVEKVKDSNLGKIVMGAREVISDVKNLNFGGAIENATSTWESLNRPKRGQNMKSAPFNQTGWKSGFGGTPDSTEEQILREEATNQLFDEKKITETDDKAYKKINRRVKVC